MDIALDFRTWGLSFHFSYGEWEPFFFWKKNRWNWIDFTVIKLGFEHSPYKDSDEVFFTILGLHFCLTRYKNFEPRLKGGWVKFRNFDKETGAEDNE